MDDGSTQRLVNRWKAGDEDAASELSDRYSQRLCDLAEWQIGRRLAKRVDSEAVANSAIRTFLRRLRTRQIRIDRSGVTWNLLAKITRNKVLRQAERHRAQCRDVSREVPLDNALRAHAAHDPTAEDVAVVIDEFEHLLDKLEPQDAEILRSQIEGVSIMEIAAKMGCSRWTVRRTLNRIGEQLQRRLD
jgi:RNA polymerase sigma factor (sigma-70 family)